MTRQRIPNLLTTLRLVLAGVFFALLSVFDYPDTARWALPVATAIFIVAAITDALDGWLARRWNAVSVYGRIADPAADKVLVLGAFVFLASSAFSDPAGGARPVTGVWAWMVAVIIAREITVTTARTVRESRGVSTAAVWRGKWKMILQSVGAPAILLVVWLADADALAGGWARTTVSAIAWTDTMVTVLSGLHYIHAGVAALRAAPEESE
ncbi:MAG: CDP-alcohol phosphatidyltransferase family protein [Phycisphaerales bacterium]